MKRILFLVLLFVVSTVVKAQYPVTQFLGSDSAMVKSRGGLQGRFAPIPFTDTTAANLSRISQYPGALIYTSGVDKYWYRNATTTGWIEFTSSGGATVNIYNSSGTLTGDRQVDGSGNDLRFNDVKEFGVGADSLVFSPNSGIFRINSLIIDDDTSTYKPLGYDPVTGKVVTRSSWVGGGGDTTSLSTRINAKLDTSKSLVVDTTGAVTGYEAYLDRTGSDTLKFRAATGGGSDSLWVIDFQPGITSNAPAVGDSLLYHSYILSKIRWVYREGKYQSIDDSVGYTISYVDTQIIFHPPLATNERIHIELKDSANYRSLPLQVKASSALLLDTYTGAAGAYSLRKLRTAYAGSAIRVRRSSDNTEQDIGFSGNYLDTTSLKSFVTTNTGYVVTWYDQSGNSYDLTQATTGSQPVIVESGGTVYRQNSQPSIKFTSASSQWMSNSGLAASSTADFYVAEIFKSNSASAGYAPLAMASNAITYQHGAAANRMYAYAGNIYGDFANSSTVLNLSEFLYDGGGATNADKLKYYLNSTGLTASSYSGSVPTTVSGTGVSVGRFYAVAAGYLDGAASELIIWLSDKSASRTGIESNINSYYVTY